MPNTTTNGRSSSSALVLSSALVALAALPALALLAARTGGVDTEGNDGRRAALLVKRIKAAAAATAAALPRSKKKSKKAEEAGGQEEQRTKKVVVVVDPYSSGGVLARLAYDEGYEVIRVLSCAAQRMADQSLPAACQGLPFAATIVESATGGPDGVLAELRALLPTLGHAFAGFLCGAEPGVELFDALTTRWNASGCLPLALSNGEALSAARRDKYLMSERVRAAGLRAVRQCRAAEWAEAEAFIKGMFPQAGEKGAAIAVILKPARSSSSEDVVLARSLPEARAAFARIRGRTNQYGEANACVLVQEFMAGTEYVVNCVSRDGVHKVVSLWRYDKRPANGAPFVYHGVRLFESPDGKVEEALAQYIFGVLGALGVVHGPSHAEVMWLEGEDAPCLVEIGCRPHGGDGVHTELARRCVGYSQLDAMLGLLLPDSDNDDKEQQKLHSRLAQLWARQLQPAAAQCAEALAALWAEGKARVFGPEAAKLTPAAAATKEQQQQKPTATATAQGVIVPFSRLPARQPRPLRAHAEVVMLVASRTGRLLGYPGLATLRGLRSFQDIALKVQPGEVLQTTVDYLTNPGWVMLVHEDPAVVAADAAAIHALAAKPGGEGGLYAVENDLVIGSGKSGSRGRRQDKEKAEEAGAESEEDGQTSEEEEPTPPASP